ncbi:MAG: glutathione S-transferase [Solirubrobacterales bacterium]|nr:glutathione S-transferase [Solirubrobacterales bacterium]
MQRFTLYGSPHSLPTYKVALMLRLSGEPFSFRYVSFQKAMHKTPEFAALSRWGQVPVLLDGDRVCLQSAAIVEHLAETLDRFGGPDPAARQAVREWMYWNADALFPPIFNSYAVILGQRKLLPISVGPAIADYHRRRAEAALWVLDTHLARRDYLCAAEPTIADLFCCGDVTFAEVCGFDMNRWTNVARWTKRVTALTGFAPPFELLAMQDAELA